LTEINLFAAPGGAEASLRAAAFDPHQRMSPNRRQDAAMASIGIVGAGAFGTAMACVLRRSGHAVALEAAVTRLIGAF
jgi:NADPH-dependent 2,4-dienoyl-CoA reductase/sulfur reductase-like enzyme